MYRALVVDDEPLMLEGMRLMIQWERCGFELAAEAGTAQDALHLIDTIGPDLLITDVKMPGMLGTDLAKLCAKHYPWLKLVFISGYQDFEYARTAIQTGAYGYLLKPIDPDEVHRVLAQVKSALDERDSSEAISLKSSHALRRVASGDHSEETLARAAELLKLSEQDECYCAIVEAGSLPQIESAYVRHVLSSLSATAFRVTAGQIGICFSGKEIDMRLLGELFEEWQRSDHPPYAIGVGRAGRGPGGFAKSLSEAQYALDAQYERHGALLMYKPYDECDRQWVDAADLPKLSAIIAQGDEQALEDWIAALRALWEGNKPPKSAMRLLAKQTELSAPSLPEGGADELRALWREEYKDTGAWIERYIAYLRGVVIAESPQALPEPVRRVMQYIKEEYNSQLSITVLAGRLYMNPAYLGQLVRKSTGMTFNRHLLSERLRHACVLLRQTRMTIREIAQEIGIRDMNYFSTQFRKELGVSPNAYRGKARGAEGDKQE